MNLTRPIESQLEMARDLACEMTTCANALDLEQKLSFYWSARQTGGLFAACKKL